MRVETEEQTIMKLLEKTRKLNKLMQNGDKVKFKEIAALLTDLINSNTYVIDVDGMVRGYALQDKFECDIIRKLVLTNQKLPEKYMEFVTGKRETAPNINHKEYKCFLLDEKDCTYEGKRTTIIPINGNGKRLGTLILARYDRDFNDDDLLLAEYAAAVIGVEILHEREAKIEESARKKAMVQIAFSTLSFSEWEAIVNILAELNGTEGILVASKVADRVGITRSVIVNAMRKFESANLIETKSLGMKGTYIKVKNEFLLDEIRNQKD